MIGATFLTHGPIIDTTFIIHQLQHIKFTMILKKSYEKLCQYLLNNIPNLK